MRNQSHLNIHLIIGTRPNYIKAAPVIKALSRSTDYNLDLIHTGQHFDHNMRDVFFQDLSLGEPSVSLNAKGETHALQTSIIMKNYDKYIAKNRPDLVIVFGDVDSTLACSLVASKMNIPIAHVESGLRSFDRKMPEEINRVLTDQISELLFTTSPEAFDNLINEGINKDKIHYVGNTMIDSLVRLSNRFDQSKIIQKLDISRPFILMTFHRPSNVDISKNLESLINSIRKLSKQFDCIFPIHPRTRKLLNELSIYNDLKNHKNILLIDPLGYIDFMNLQKHASVVITDSGGIQEESTFLGIPCLTVRESTERPITVLEGTNKIIGTSYNNIVEEAKLAMKNKYKINRKIPDLWDGKAAERIWKVFQSNFNV